MRISDWSSDVCSSDLLHHADLAQAEALLRAFLRAARESGAGCVRIIHGKGLHSDSRIPPLKNLVDRMLRQRADVLAFHSAPAAPGGGGAGLVLLGQRCTALPPDVSPPGEPTQAAWLADT